MKQSQFARKAGVTYRTASRWWQQGQRLLEYCEADGYLVDRSVKEIASGLNDHRPKF
jgi:predicted site-specific integrase-resolvase